MTTHTCSRMPLTSLLSSSLVGNMNMTPSSSLARLSGEDSLSRVAGIAPAPLLPGEQEAEYATLVARIVVIAEPRDAIEDLLTRDVVDLSWEILRLRRAKVGILKASMSDGVEGVLDQLGYGQGERYGYTKSLGQSWAAGDKKTRKEITAALSAAGLTIDEVTAKTLESKLDSFERLDRMLASAEARRNNALREIDRHRAALGAAMRQAVDEVQDAEFRDVETGVPRVGAPP
jgi:ribosomal protein L12E/L44/L45/RPP1/RPP2